MSKARIYELAKELNTTSKRLMEKLAEINIDVKNHMSLLEEHELNALYKHIGVIKHDDNKGHDTEEKRHIPPMPPKLAEAKKDAKSAPRIIRKTEIVIDSREENRDNKNQTRFDNSRNYDNNRNYDNRNDNKGNNRGQQNQSYVRPSASTSGLRPGYVRDTGVDFKKDNRQPQRTDVRDNRSIPQRDMVNTDTHDSVKATVHKEPTVSVTDHVKEPVKEKPVEKVLQGEAPDTKTVQQHKTEENINPAINAEKKETNNEVIAKVGKEIENMNNTSAKTVEMVKSEEETKQVKETEVRNESPRQQVERPQGDRPQGDFNRQQGDRPQGGYNRPYGGDRPQGGGYNRQQGDRPQGGGYNRQQGDRPQGGGYNRQQGDRPQGGGYNRQQGDRPQGDFNRQQGDRPQGGYNRPYGDRPQGGGYNRQQGDRPQGGGFNRQQGDRPQGGGFNRQQGDRPQGGGFNRQQGDRPQGGGFNRQQGDRPQGGFRSGGPRPLEIPKPEFTAAQKEEMNSQRSEIRREFQNKEAEKDVKREQKRDTSKTAAPGKEKRFKPQTVVLSQKKGVSEILDEEFILDEFYGDDGVKVKKNSKPKKNERVQEGNRHIPHKAVLTSITIPETITVKDLAESLKKTSTDIIKKLMTLGVMATLNQEVDFDTATLIADEFGVKVEKQVVVNEEDILFDEENDKEEELVPRPPVVVVMGHVDHGKTSLLDAIREANVIDTEAGGITQHIGAYTVKIHDRIITFLDTPGHEAFTAMRARGAQVTDIAILVVAADDGVMPQTVEAINHAKAANVSIIVAINKIDKPGANPDRVKQELTEYGIVAEEWGGDAIMVPVSAKKRTNIDGLLEMVTLAADVLELKSNPNRQAKGTIIEAKLDKARGPVATMLVQRGTLKIGDSIVTGTTVGRIRAMTDDKGHKVKKAGPSTPVEILGLPEVPEAGEIFYAITDEKVARQLADKRKLKQREQTLKASAKVSLDDLFNQIKEGKVKDLNIIVKADVQGSVEAVKQSLEKLSNDEVRVKIIHGGVGAINEADVTLASISNAIIIGFNVRPGANVSEAAENSGVDMRLYRVIYNAIEDVQAAMKGLLDPTFKEVVLGHAEVRQIFKVSGVGTIGGCYVTDGKILRNSEVRVVRNGIVVHEGKLDSLKRFKDDAKEVAQGFECGLQIERYNDIKEGDIVESYIMEEVKR